MIFACCRQWWRIASQIARAVNDFLVDIANHHLQVKIVHRLSAEVLQLLEVLPQRFERSGLASFLPELFQGFARRIGLKGSIHRKEVLFRGLYREW
jgi:hypothetical protein